MAIDDHVGRIELFEQIVGTRPWSGHFAGDVPPFDIPPEKVDETYLLIKKFQRSHRDPTNQSDAYYLADIEKVDLAYLAGNLPDYTKAVRGLMLGIDCD